MEGCNGFICNKKLEKGLYAIHVCSWVLYIRPSLSENMQLPPFHWWFHAERRVVEDPLGEVAKVRAFITRIRDR